MSAPTRRQQQVYDFLVDFLDQHGYPPTLQEIAQHLGVSGNLGVLRQVKAMERHALIARNPGSSRGITLKRPTATGELPLIGTVQAGLPRLATEEVEGYFKVDESLVKSEDAFLLKVRADSMLEAHILAGDLAVIRPQSTAENGEIVVAMIGGEATLKRFYRQGDHIRLQPENSQLPPIIIPAESAEVTIIGKVTGLCRNLG